VSAAVTVDGSPALTEGCAVIPPVSIPLPVPSGLLVDLIEVLEVHAEALEVRSDGEVLTIAAVAATTGSVAPLPAAGPAELPPAAPAPRTTAEVPLGSRPQSSNGSAPSPAPAVATSAPAGTKRGGGRSSAGEEILAAVVAVSGFDIDDLRRDDRRAALRSWRKVAAYVAYQRGVNLAVFSTHLCRRPQFGRRCVNDVETRPDDYRAMVDRVVAHLDGARAASASDRSSPRDLSRGDVDDGPPPADLDHPAAPAPLEGDGDELAETPPPSPGFPPPPRWTRRPFDPDAARAAAAGAL
jgi:hypothetical protein